MISPLLLAAALIALATAAAQAAPLLLSPLIAKGEYAQAKKLSSVTLDGKNLGASAFISVPSKSGQNTNNIYFWYQECTSASCVAKRKAGKAGDVPFILWLQGGPGAPGTFGALSEIGQTYLDKDSKVQDRCFSWCKDANCLFVDQPVQTGFSFQLNKTGHFDPKNIEYTKTSAEAMEQIWQLLKQFGKVWPEVASAPFYVTGESYGGLYTAHMGYVIYQHNEDKAESFKINLAGLAVGDPIINAEYQWLTYPSTLYGMGVIMLEERAKLDEVFINAIRHLETDCVTAFNYWNSVWNDNGGGGAPGLYYEMTGSSMTEDVQLGQAPDAFNRAGPWFNSTVVAQAFHIDGTPGGHNMNEGGKVYATMVESGDFCSNSSWIYATLFLKTQIDVMIYSSTADPLLGPPTTEAGVAATWVYAAEHLPGGVKAADAYWMADKTIWKVAKQDTNPAGYARCTDANGKRFCYAVVRNGGHTLPAFEPRASYDMFQRFVHGRAFDASGESPNTPQCAQCGGVPPFAGDALPECVCGKSL
jgi:vitellogenic carboxypeptidase-like protein